MKKEVVQIKTITSFDPFRDFCWVLITISILKYQTSSKKINLRELFVKKIKYIFNDGAPQHFKQKKAVSFWAALQMELGINLNMHFYVSYHGHNVCDAHASHMKLSVLRNKRSFN